MALSTQDRRILGILFPPTTRRKLALAVAGSVIVSIVEAASILLLLPLMELLGGASPTSGSVGRVSSVLGNPDPDQLMLILVSGVLVGFILKDVFALGFRWWLLGFITREQVRTASRILSYFLNAPYLLHVRRSMADMMRSMGNAVGHFYGRTVSGALGIVTEGVSILAITIGLLVAVPVPALIIITFFGAVALLFARVIRPRAEAAGQRQLQAGFEAFEATIHSFGGIKEIKIRHAQEHFVGRYRRAAIDQGMAGRVSIFLQEAPKYLLEIIFIVGFGITLLVSRATGTDGSALATLAVMGAAGFRMLPAVTRLLGSVTAVRTGEPARQLLFSELTEEQEHPARATVEGSGQTMALTRELRFDRVAFTYPDAAAPVLHDVSFACPAGSTIAFVGGSGAGKTTVANLLMGLLDPTDGRILADGQDVSTDLRAWQGNIAFVPQDAFHMDLRLDENIAFDEHAADIDQERLAGAIRLAQLDDVIAGLPQGLETRVGDRGIRLSGGQLQRVAIARALYRGPRLLVLDEATSALDNETEQRITATINSLHGAMTIVVIAHRLSTVRAADSIVFLSNGRVAAQGTFAELVTRNREFAALVELGRLDDPEPEAARDDAR